MKIILQIQDTQDSNTAHAMLVNPADVPAILREIAGRQLDWSRTAMRVGYDIAPKVQTDSEPKPVLDLNKEAMREMLAAALEMSDPNHPNFRDSAADVVQFLWDVAASEINYQPAKEEETAS